MRALLLWLLILAQPVYGASATSLRLLGPTHWHAAPAAAVQADWLQPVWDAVQRVATRVQALREQAHVRAHALGHRHEHASLQRHWHDAGDDSVHTVETGDPAVADLVAGAAAGSAMLALAAPVPPLRLPAPGAHGRWPPAPTPAWSDADPVRVAPPPRR